MKRYLLFSAAALAAFTMAACKKAPPAGVAAEVNGRPITVAELEKIYQSQYAQGAEGASAEMITSQKLDLLANLITSEILVQRAEKMGLAAVDSEVEAQLTKFKAPYTKEEFDKQLAAQKLTLDDLKLQIRRQLTRDKLLNKEIISHITITDADVTNFYNANKSSFNLPQPQLHLAQILVSPQPDAEVRNLKNSKAQNETEARAKINDIMVRLKRGEDFATVAQNYSEDPKSTPNGGDMGFIFESGLDQVSPELRKMLLSLPQGGITPPVPTPQGYRIFKMIGREPAGQRDLRDPNVQSQIRDQLRQSKEQLLQGAYYEVARNSAKVENYMAQQIVDSVSKK